MKKMIAIVGMAGSGKSIASSYLEEKGYQKIYFGGAIYQKMKEENIEITPESQKEYREDIRDKYGMGAVAMILLPKIEEAIKQGDVVLDGLYSWSEYKILKEKFKDLKVIGVVSDKKLRYDRIRDRVDRPFTTDEIIVRDVSEIENIEKGGPIAYADYYILNNFDLSSYYQRLEEIIKTIEKEYNNEENE